jgi:hypothetical protein
MSDVKSFFDRYVAEARSLRDTRPADLNAVLVELENTIADHSGLPEWKRLELRSYMQEHRRQLIDGYDAGAGTASISDT